MSLNKNEIVTFGCRLNIYESEVIREALAKSGEENVVVFNTCAVTKEAERQAKQAIRKAKKEHPDKKIIVTGCAAQINPSQFAKMSEVDRVLGNEEKLASKNYSSIEIPQEEKVIVNDIMSVKETALHLVSSFEGRARAFIQIQNGCNHRCTFCTIPFGRGNSRSVPLGEIIAQIRRLVEAGYNEIVLTGVDITDYGLDLPGSPSLGQMIKRIFNLVPNLPRLRLSSIDVAEIDQDLYDLMLNEIRLMPHFHISLQAGDNMILKRMKRRHNRENIIEFYSKIREKLPYASFGADIIAGFPTETDEMFENSLKLVEEADLVFLHVFPYSERDGTPAAKMPPVAKNIRKERARILREAGDKQLKGFLNRNVGLTASVVVEKENSGKAENFTEVILDKPQKIGDIVKAKIVKAYNNKLCGEVTE